MSLVKKNHEQNILDYLKELVRFDTQNPPRDLTAKSEIYQYLTEHLHDDFDVQIFDHGLGRVSFYAVRGKPRIIFNVHLDTVPAVEGWESNPHDLVLDNDHVIGLGSCDIKGAAACLLALAKQDERDLALLFTSDEEGANGYCVEAFLQSEHAEQYQQAVVAEPTLCKAVTRHSGFISMHGHFSGVAGHSSDLQALSKSALHHLIQWGNQALDFVNDKFAGNTLSRFNIGTINGGVKSNITANHAKVVWSARLEPGSNANQFIQDIKSCAPINSNVSWEKSFVGESLPDADNSTEESEKFIQTHSLTQGKPVGFWTEAALFNKANIPAFVLGPGDIAQAHTANEWIAISQLLKAYSIYERISR